MEKRVAPPSATRERLKKPRFTAGGRVTKNRNEIYTAQIDEKGAHWYGCIQIHRSSKAEATSVRNLFLRVLNK